MTLIIPPCTTLTVWLIYSQDNTGIYIEGAFTSKPQAEAALRRHESVGHLGMTHWIQELQTEPHEG